VTLLAIGATVLVGVLGYLIEKSEAKNSDEGGGSTQRKAEGKGT
jgi:hypothetical protein